MAFVSAIRVNMEVLSSRKSASVRSGDSETAASASEAADYGSHKELFLFVDCRRAAAAAAPASSAQSEHRCLLFALLPLRNLHNPSFRFFLRNFVCLPDCPSAYLTDCLCLERASERASERRPAERLTNCLRSPCRFTR